MLKNYTDWNSTKKCNPIGNLSMIIMQTIIEANIWSLEHNYQVQIYAFPPFSKFSIDSHRNLHMHTTNVETRKKKIKKKKE